MQLKYWNNSRQGKVVSLLSFETGSFGGESTQPNPGFTLFCECSGHKNSCPLPAKSVSNVFCGVFSLAFHPTACSAQLQTLHFHSSPHKDQELQSGPNKHIQTCSGGKHLFTLAGK